jgi:hypothetical protein
VQLVVDPVLFQHLGQVLRAGEGEVFLPHRGFASRTGGGGSRKPPGAVAKWRSSPCQGRKALTTKALCHHGNFATVANERGEVGIAPFVRQSPPQGSRRQRGQTAPSVARRVGVVKGTHASRVRVRGSCSDPCPRWRLACNSRAPGWPWLCRSAESQASARGCHEGPLFVGTTLGRGSDWHRFL